MPLDLELTTELEAVNAILGAVGEAPINSFDETFTDASMALSLLQSQSRLTQARGWHFNTELGYVLQPDGTKTIYLPRNTLRVLPQDGSTDYVQRGRKLYDRTNRTYEFESSVTVDLVLALPFEELPEAARQYLTIKAGRRFQDQYQSDQALHQFTVRDEVSAWASLENFEAETAKHNVLTNFALMTRIRGNR